ncbi:ABC transporter ATP-binding protein [Curtobacterium sp. NPDC087082]|uniref:ABC transporter ATP-binding protein n=1 Tax=Curtobacterium sp. NPDC087082 TaxID=3363966 RepID=UPI003829C1C3
MIRLTSLSKSIRERNGDVRTLFRDLDFDMSASERSVAILGRSGSGKSTLLRILAGLDVDFGGLYSYDGTQLPKSPSSMAAHRLERIGIVTQAYDLLPDRTVAANVAIGCARRRGASARVAEALELVGIDHLASKRPTHLSGGEAQRVAIARAIVKRPSVVLADEPTGALDEGTEEEVLHLFERLQDGGTQFVIVTHSDRVAQRCGRRKRISEYRLVDVD